MSENRILAGRYRLTAALGEGGMGAVWRAHDLTLGAEVAVKMINPALAESAEALARFKREAQAAAAIRSTYVVQILDYGVDANTPYIAMELLKGENLADRLRRVRRLSPEHTATLLGQVGRALALAHEHYIVHRDMKPENVFLASEDTEDVAKVLDFGIARVEGGPANVSLVKTSTGAMLGTPYYMSPEQAAGQPVDHRTDIWSFGAIAFQCLVGDRPFDGKSLGELFHAICMARLPVPSERGSVPHGFDEWFARAVARDKSERYQTIKEATDRLRAVCGGNAAQHQSTQRSSGGLDQASLVQATSTQSAPLEKTAPPASRTIAGLEGRSSTVAVAIAAALAIAVGGLWAALRTKPDVALRAPGQVPSSAVRASVSAATSSSAPPVSSVEPGPEPQGSSTQAPTVSRQLAPAPPRRSNAAKAADGSQARPNLQQPSATPAKPINAPADDDNAAGI